jgi:hypothetical protein
LHFKGLQDVCSKIGPSKIALLYQVYISDIGSAARIAVVRASGDLRHTGLTRLRKQELGIPELAVVSGHRDWKMLQRYVDVTADDILAAEA